MAKSRIIKTSKNTGYRLGDTDDNIVVFEGVKLVKHITSKHKDIQLKEVQFGSFDELTISRFNNIEIENDSLVLSRKNFGLSVFFQIVSTLLARNTD